MDVYPRRRARAKNPDCPRLVGLVHNVVTECLKEEGILD